MLKNRWTPEIIFISVLKKKKKKQIWSKLHFLDKTSLKKSKILCHHWRKTTKYFQLKSGARQDDSISTFLFILVF